MTVIKVGSIEEFPDGECRVLSVDGLEVGVFRQGERLVAYQNVCPHYGGPVCQGKIFNRVEEVIAPDQTSRGLRFGGQRHIVCPWHGYEFDLESGAHPGDPDMRLTRIAIEVRDDAVYLEARGRPAAR